MTDVFVLMGVNRNLAEIRASLYSLKSLRMGVVQEAYQQGGYDAVRQAVNIITEDTINAYNRMPVSKWARLATPFARANLNMQDLSQFRRNLSSASSHVNMTTENIQSRQSRRNTIHLCRRCRKKFTPIPYDVFWHFTTILAHM